MPILSSVYCWCVSIHLGFSLCPKEKGTIRVYSSFSLVSTSHDGLSEARKVLEVPVPLRVRASSLWSSPFSPQKGDADRRGGVGIGSGSPLTKREGGSDNGRRDLRDRKGGFPWVGLWREPVIPIPRP
jgi:hypothetical protein